MIPSDRMIRIVSVSEDVDGYLNIFLVPDYEKTLIMQFPYGFVVDERDDNHVRQIVIPLLKGHDIQKQINDLLLETNKKRFDV